MTSDTFQNTYQQALAALDSQLSRVNRELATLAAARPADPDAVTAAVLRAQQAAESVGSVVAEAAAAVGDPPPLWATREELESTAERITEKLKTNAGNARRSRLQAIASSLLVAQVLHPRWKKVVPALDALRLRAVAQLQEVASGMNPPDLPGPVDGGAWLAWAWELPTEEVEDTLAVVRAVVPALVEVVLEIDPGHWVVIAEAIAMPESLGSGRDSHSEAVIPQADRVSDTASSILSDMVPIADEVSIPTGTVLPSESWIGGKSAPGLNPLSSSHDSSVLPGPRVKPRNNLPELPRKIDGHKEKKGES
ncbi:MAG: hypothetical protein C0467_18840 [Planctomycetaceae bacterium]|nr:hypothetical protein [Planctomycetaceae bacterium]